jgi:protein gp37
MSDTKIQWTDTTWNVVTGCTKISAGCKNCYAERDWHRVYGGGAPKAMRDKYGIRKFTDVLCHEDRLNQPLRWQRPRMIFVNSMSDLFHEDVPVEFITSAFEVMRSSWRHTFQVLTKRPERMRQFMKDWLWLTWRPAAPLSNVWLGVSCEDQKAADERIPILRSRCYLRCLFGRG